MWMCSRMWSKGMKEGWGIYHLSSVPLPIQEWRMMTSWPISPNSQWMPLKVTDDRVNCVRAMAIPWKWVTLFGAKIHKDTSFQDCTVSAQIHWGMARVLLGKDPQPLWMSAEYVTKATPELHLVLCIYRSNYNAQSLKNLNCHFYYSNHRSHTAPF